MLALSEGTTVVTRRHFDAAQQEDALHDERKSMAILQQDPAALQGRASAESAAAGIPVIFIVISFPERKPIDFLNLCES
jgi:hypothetical protein